MTSNRAGTSIVAGGASARERANFGVADRERADRLVDNIEICRWLWSEERVAQMAHGWMTTRLDYGLAHNNWAGIEAALTAAGPSAPGPRSA